MEFVAFFVVREKKGETFDRENCIYFICIDIVLEQPFVMFRA